MSYRVYRYVFPDGKVYVGMTKHTLDRRWTFGYQHNERLTAALREVGINALRREVIVDGLTEEEAGRLEQFYIAKFRATDPEYGYNISPGGKATYRGLKHTEEYKRHMSEITKGKVYSEKTLNLFRTTAHEKERKAVIQYSVIGEYVKEHSGLRLAAAEIGGYASNISRACASGRPYKNSLWRFKEGGDLG